MKKTKLYKYEEEGIENTVSEPMEPDSKEYIIAGLRDAFLELKEVRAGKGKTRPAEELLKR